MAFLERNLDQLALVQKQVSRSPAVRNRVGRTVADIAFFTFAWTARRPEHVTQEGSRYRRTQAPGSQRADHEPRAAPAGRRPSTGPAERQVRAAVNRHEGPNRSRSWSVPPDRTAPLTRPLKPDNDSRSTNSPSVQVSGSCFQHRSHRQAHPRRRWFCSRSVAAHVDHVRSRSHPWFAALSGQGRRGQHARQYVAEETVVVLQQGLMR